MSEILLAKGRPDDLTGREAREIAAYDFLDKLGIDYTRADHAPANTMQACVEIDERLGLHICKNLFLCNRQKTAFYLLLMPDDKPFATKELSGQLGVARLSFGSAEDLQAHLGLLPGSVSVLGLLNDPEREVRLLIDRDLLGCERFGCHPLVNTSTLTFTTRELLDVVIPALGHTPTVVDLGQGE